MRNSVSDKHSGPSFVVEVDVVCAVMTPHNLVGHRIAWFLDHKSLMKFVFSVYISLAEVEPLLLFSFVIKYLTDFSPAELM